MSRRTPPKQMVFKMRRYIVRSSTVGDQQIDAESASAAKYAAYQRAFEAGVFLGEFHEFCRAGVTARADRRPLRTGTAAETGL